MYFSFLILFFKNNKARKYFLGEMQDFRPKKNEFFFLKPCLTSFKQIKLQNHKKKRRACSTVFKGFIVFFF